MRIALLAAALCACAAPGPVRPPDAPAPIAHHPLRAGTVVVLSPLELTVGGDDGEPALADGLWRESLRQSDHLDVAMPGETPASDVLVLTLDARAGVLASSLRQGAEPPVPLAQTSAGDGFDRAIDRLALATRRALGDPASAPDTLLPAAALYSNEPRCVAATEAALGELGQGMLRAAVTRLRAARVTDPGCTFTLALMAEALLDLGEPAEAAKVAREALAFEARLGPVTAHRLARTLVLAREDTGSREAELVELAASSRRERPHDPQPKYTAALAWNRTGRFGDAAPLLRELAVRWQNVARVPYQLAFAELGSGDPAAALRALEGAGARLPRHNSLLPRALALWALRRDAELATELETMAAEPVVRQGPLRHELLRMQAAHALLCGRGEAAARYLLEDLEWLRQRPSRLGSLTLDLVEAGEVLVRLERTADLEQRLPGFSGLEHGAPGLRDALAYLSGLVAIARGREAAAAEASFERQDLRVWSLLLRAAAHRRKGELLDEGRVLAQAAMATEDPLVHASLARAMRAAGNDAGARELLDQLRARLTRIDLLRPREHVLLSPARALAWIATEPAR